MLNTWCSSWYSVSVQEVLAINFIISYLILQIPLQGDDNPA